MNGALNHAFIQKAVKPWRPEVYERNNLRAMAISCMRQSASTDATKNLHSSRVGATPWQSRERTTAEAAVRDETDQASSRLAGARRLPFEELKFLGCLLLTAAPGRHQMAFSEDACVTLLRLLQLRLTTTLG